MSAGRQQRAGGPFRKERSQPSSLCPRGPVLTRINGTIMEWHLRGHQSGAVVSRNGGRRRQLFAGHQQLVQRFVSTTQSVVIQPNLTRGRCFAKAVAGSINKVFLTFDQTLDTVSATALATYSSPYFAVSSAALSPDGIA